MLKRLKDWYHNLPAKRKPQVIIGTPILIVAIIIGGFYTVNALTSSTEPEKEPVNNKPLQGNYTQEDSIHYITGNATGSTYTSQEYVGDRLPDLKVKVSQLEEKNTASVKYIASDRLYGSTRFKTETLKPGETSISPPELEAQKYEYRFKVRFERDSPKIVTPLLLEAGFQ